MPDWSGLLMISTLGFVPFSNTIHVHRAPNPLPPVSKLMGEFCAKLLALANNKIDKVILLIKLTLEFWGL